MYICKGKDPVVVYRLKGLRLYIKTHQLTSTVHSAETVRIVHRTLSPLLRGKHPDSIGILSRGRYIYYNVAKYTLCDVVTIAPFRFYSSTTPAFMYRSFKSALLIVFACLNLDYSAPSRMSCGISWCFPVSWNICIIRQDPLIAAFYH